MHGGDKTGRGAHPATGPIYISRQIRLVGVRSGNILEV